LLNPEKSIVICDANIIIDFSGCDISLLRGMTRLFQKVYVPYLVLYGLADVSEQVLMDAGIELMETPLEVSPVKGLSTEDWACVLALKQTEGICITNDRKLRSVASEMGYDVMWGLETLREMWRNKIITKAKAKKCGMSICERNKYISAQLKREFLEKLSQ
jgi:predicted nucleic acid-binding protein